MNDTVLNHIIDSASNGQGMNYPKTGNINKLTVTHNAGFFSCSTIALQDIVIWSREHKRLPDIVDRHGQYTHYKSQPLQSLIGHFFNEQPNDIDCSQWFEVSYDNRELQFSDYHKLDFAATKPFIDKYFTPSQYVLDIVANLERKYNIDYDRTCALYYRGNDKNREMQVAPYEMFIDKAKEVLAHNKSTVAHKGLTSDADLRFLIQPDETEFLQACYNDLPNCFNFEETPSIPKQDSAIFFELPIEQRADFAAHFLAATIIVSKCKHLITHTGNCGFWACLYRGNVNNVHQIRDNVWL